MEVHTQCLGECGNTPSPAMARHPCPAMSAMAPQRKAESLPDQPESLSAACHPKKWPPNGRDPKIRIHRSPPAHRHGPVADPPGLWETVAPGVAAGLPARGS